MTVCPNGEGMVIIMKEEKCLKIETIAVHGSKGFDPVTGAVSFPIYQSATFRHPGLKESTGYDYSRLQNPTREELEGTVAKLEGGFSGLAFSTGLAAITAMMSIFKPGDHVVVSEDLYGGTYRLFKDIYIHYGIEADLIDTTNSDNIKKYIRDNTKAIFIETPSNPMMKVTDIKEVSHIAKEKGLLLIVDNTFLTPYFQRPLELGADIVIHSGTKFLGGHNDTLAGFLVVKNEELNTKLRFIQKSTGAVLSPFDSWLILRGIKTLPLRMQRQEENALVIAQWLKHHEAVDKVYYIGLPDHEGYEVSKKQSSGFGSMISFTVKDKEIIPRLLKNIKVIIFAESLGGVETLITYPKLQTHADIPEAIREDIGITDYLLRLSVGVENIEDLIEDLQKALR
jgi:cystathionine gamma-synthase